MWIRPSVSTFIFSKTMIWLFTKECTTKPYVKSLLVVFHLPEQTTSSNIRMQVCNFKCEHRSSKVSLDSTVKKKQLLLKNFVLNCYCLHENEETRMGIFWEMHVVMYHRVPLCGKLLDKRWKPFFFYSFLFCYRYDQFGMPFVTTHFVRHWKKLYEWWVHNGYLSS